jgi:hypothetical protein
MATSYFEETENELQRMEICAKSTATLRHLRVTYGDGLPQVSEKVRKILEGRMLRNGLIFKSIDKG